MNPTPRPRPRSSGMHINPVTPLGQLVAVLERYVTPLTVDSMLRRSLDHLGLTVEGVTPRNLERVVEEVMVGLRLFCEGHRLPDLMVELAELCHRVAR
jgi:hypothetical protein